jgi:hypothetical protein
MACGQADVVATLPKPVTWGMIAQGQFGKHDFRYQVEQDTYVCPAGQTLSFISHKRQTGASISGDMRPRDAGPAR